MGLMRIVLAAGYLAVLAGVGCGEETSRTSDDHAQADSGAREQGASVELAADGGGGGGTPKHPAEPAQATQAVMDAGSPAPRQKSKEPAPAKSTPPASPDEDDDAGAGLPPAQQAAALASLGERLFQDRTLSVTSTQSCATCHVSDSAFTGSADHDNPYAPVSKGATGQVFGTRNAPTAMYTEFNPPFAFVQTQATYAPIGGLFWDGRASSLSEQAAAPFVNAREMGLADKQAVIERVRKAAYATMFEPLFGAQALSDVEPAYQHVTDAIAAFERTPLFHPFSSKFDAYLQGQAQLSAQEQQGFELFKDPDKASCITCHVGKLDSHEPSDWLFTDFSYAALGVPRNLKIVDNAAVSYFDLGLCQAAGFMDKIPAAIEDKAAFAASFCGAFRVPSLRNVAKTAPYMHNGFFVKLRDAVDFLVTRDTDPTRWYPSAADAGVPKLDDLPEQYQANLHTDAPFERGAGEQPRLSADEIDAVVAFLSTLSDGYTP